MVIQPEPVLSLGAILGEGPVWVKRDQSLWFVDIKAWRIYCFDPATSAVRSWPTPEQIGWILPAKDGAFAVGLQSGIHRFDPATSTFELVHDPEPHLPGNRLNDATVDRDGRIWFGSMDDAENQDSGRIYRMELGHAVDMGVSPVCVLNGPAISPDGTLLYHVDTWKGLIWRSRIGQNGCLSETRVFAEIETGAGFPDGPVVDAEGCLWVGLFGGWGVRRYDPDGAMIGQIAFPVANITKIAFGGSDLSTAFATTARKGLSEAELQAQSLAGDVFAFDAAVCGLPTAEAVLP
ncbi:SMP-30/gluconolactonase/LRE family protein [Sphingobium algorifonticola]|uniref:SMP-30/gluconolactonase/LRE family protein n=1 Tax=Sphingobium algorifonticola TaxID=2008318 RepID=A0A437J497_9SPHN|nr:SMP-30/gluconolactonase/LRE family protein [Sphingobium algorifonticola]RVT39445.1 SMP-30/gluconolactonase/LRE family protein [Sphingobium algorifonticola]